MSEEGRQVAADDVEGARQLVDPKVRRRRSFWGARRGQERRRFLEVPCHFKKSDLFLAWAKSREIYTALFKKRDVPSERRDASGLAVWRRRKGTTK